MEEPIIGLKNIAEYVYLSPETIKKKSKQWQKQGILIARLRGKPPNRHKVIISYPSLLQKILGK